MHHVLKHSLLRTSAMITCAAVGCVVGNAPAQAVTVNSLSLSGVSSSSGSCLVNANVSLTGTNVDGTGAFDFDLYTVGARSASGSPHSLFTTLIEVGSTAAGTQGGVIPISAGRDDYFYSIYETGPGGNASNPGPIVASVPIPRNTLIGAGGACAQLATNTAPIANAGPDQNVNTTSASGVTLPVTASGSSDPDGDALSFNWTQISGPQANINNANQVNASISFPTLSGVTVFQFQVAVTDAAGETSHDTVRISLTPPANSPPAVDAGVDQTVAGGSAVNLAGAASDPDNDPLTYQWTQSGGPSVTIGGDTTLTPTFTAPARAFSAQTMTFELAVNDGTVTTTDTVVITVAANLGPSADAGQPQSVPGGSSVTLDGSGSSDPEGDALIYNWTQVSGSGVALSGANTASPTFTAPLRTNSQQALEFQLRVTDTLDASDTASVTITIPANQSPIADAGPDQTRAGNSSVLLDGSGSSDPEGDPINYSWVQTSGTSVTLTNPNSINPSFTAPAGIVTDQILTFQLTVDDDAGSGAGAPGRLASNPQQDTVDIRILANTAPVADAGTDQGPIDSGQTVTLNGSGSSDPEGDNLSYNWTQVSGTPVSLTGSSSDTSTFVAPLVSGNEDLVFALVVNDGQLDSVADTVTISVRAVGTVTINQRVIGGDTPVTFTSTIPALNGIVTTANGAGQISASSVAAGSYAVSVNDLTASGYAVTDISCNDADSVANLSSRSIALEISPSEDLVCTFTSVNSREAASTAIADFLTGRNALIMSHQPDLQRRLDRLDGAKAQPGSATAYGVPIPGSGALPFEMSLGGGQGSASTSLSQARAAAGAQDRVGAPFDIWGEAFFARVRLGNQRANFRIFHVGADYRIGENLLLGALAEFDDFNDRGDLEAGEAEGNGWLIGPYAMVRLAPELFAEVRAGWGKSDNRVSSLGTYIDEFETSRSYYSGSLVGQFELGGATQVRPEVTIRFLDEKQLAYTDSLNVLIPEQSVGQGDISFRPRVHHIIKLDSGWILRPFGEVEGIYTFGTAANNVLDNGLRARVEGGFDLLSGASFRASIVAFHDGVGADNFRSNGIRTSISFGF